MPEIRYTVYKDGNAWFCVDQSFTNLQESNYAYSHSPEKVDMSQKGTILLDPSIEGYSKK